MWLNVVSLAIVYVQVKTITVTFIVKRIHEFKKQNKQMMAANIRIKNYKLTCCNPMKETDEIIYLKK